MTDRITLQLGVFGALHQCETVISLLNGASRALGEHSREGFDAITSEALSVIARLQRAVDELSEENERQRVAEYEASLRAPPANVTRLSDHRLTHLIGAGQ